MRKIITVFVALFALALGGVAPGVTNSQTKKAEGQAAPAPPDEVNVRAFTRNKLFTSTPEALGLKGADVEAKVWGVVQEVADPSGGDASTTLLVLRDGEARISTSSTDGLAYGGYVARAEAKKFLAEAEKQLPRMKPTKEFPYPSAGRLRFYLLTRDGVYTLEADREAAGTQGHALFPLCLAGYHVLVKVQEGAAKLRPPQRP